MFPISVALPSSKPSPFAMYCHLAIHLPAAFFTYTALLFVPTAKARHSLSIDGFLIYLCSPDGSIFNPEHQKVFQDMSQPLCHYFISSSHNTYLMEDQLRGQSSVEGYIRYHSQSTVANMFASTFVVFYNRTKYKIPPQYFMYILHQSGFILIHSAQVQVRSEWCLNFLLTTTSTHVYCAYLPWREVSKWLGILFPLLTDHTPYSTMNRHRWYCEPRCLCLLLQREDGRSWEAA